MPKTSRAFLEGTRRGLESVKAREIPEARWQSIDWQHVKGLLHQLDQALDENKEAEIDQTLNALLTRLKIEERRFRGQIGAEPKDRMQPMPKPVWELLNHIVDKIDYTLSKESSLASEQIGDGKPQKEPGEEH